MIEFTEFQFRITKVYTSCLTALVDIIKINSFNTHSLIVFLMTNINICLLILELIEKSS